MSAAQIAALTLEIHRRDAEIRALRVALAEIRDLFQQRTCPPGRPACAGCIAARALEGGAP